MHRSRRSHSKRDSLPKRRRRTRAGPARCRGEPLVGVRIQGGLRTRGVAAPLVRGSCIGVRDVYRAADALICLCRWLHRFSHERHHGHRSGAHPPSGHQDRQPQTSGRTAGGSPASEVAATVRTARTATRRRSAGPGIRRRRWLTTWCAIGLGVAGVVGYVNSDMPFELQVMSSWLGMVAMR
jgi:hypothetical protein